jgi:molybdate transport system substrate-binding protein
MSPLAVRPLALSTVALALALLGGCAESSTPAAQGSAAQESAAQGSNPPNSPPAVTGELTVLAAASLTGVFTRLGDSFMAAHPGLTVRFSFDASSRLAQQIVAKAPADVFASASPANMKTVQDAGGTAGEPIVFVRNQLQIVTPKDNPGTVRGLTDFGRSDLNVVVCAVEVPCGAAADAVFAAAGVTESIDSFEQNVKGVLTKVAGGEADAGLVYRTDVLAAGGQVVGIEFAESAGAVNDYPIALLAEAKNPTAAAAWVAFLSGEEARTAFREAGFQTP